MQHQHVLVTVFKIDSQTQGKNVTELILEMLSDVNVENDYMKVVLFNKISSKHTSNIQYKQNYGQMVLLIHSLHLLLVILLPTAWVSFDPH